MGLFSRRRSTKVLQPILFGLGGAALGAAITLFLTPTTGRRARAFLRDLLGVGEHEHEDIDAQLEAMESEGGLMGSSTRSGSGRAGTHA